MSPLQSVAVAIIEGMGVQIKCESLVRLLHYITGIQISLQFWMLAIIGRLVSSNWKSDSKSTSFQNLEAYRIAVI